MRLPYWGSKPLSKCEGATVVGDNDIESQQERESRWHGIGHLVGALWLAILMFGLGFLAGNRWAEQRALESEKVVVGRLMPPQVEMFPQEVEGESEDEGRFWNVLIGRESPSAILPQDQKVQQEAVRPPRGQRGRESVPEAKARQERSGIGSHIEQPANESSRGPSQGAPGVAPRYVVQAVSVQTREKAESILRELNGKGYPLVRIVAAEVPGRGVWYRVWVGSFRSKEEAEAVRAKLEERERLKAQVVSEGR